LRFNDRVKEITVSDGDIERWIEKYSRFLSIKQKHPKVAFVPTLDIDIIWHAHQLDHVNYRKDSVKYLGFVLNHNDMPSNAILLNSFGATARLWKKEYGQDYVQKTMSKVRKPSRESPPGPSCMSCGFGDHSSHSKLPHNTESTTLPDTVSNPDMDLALGTGDVTVSLDGIDPAVGDGGSTIDLPDISCLSCISVDL
jgi:hypothetical protein